MGPSWVSPSSCTEEADPEQQRMAEVADEPFGSGCAKGTSRCPLHPSAGSRTAVMLVPLTGLATAPCPPVLVAAAPGAELPAGHGTVPQDPVLSQS